MTNNKDYFGSKLEFGEISLFHDKNATEELGGCCDGRFFSVIRCSGLDAKNYLNGQTSNQLNQLKSGDGHASSFNTPKGKTIALMDIYRFENDYFLVFAANAQKRVLETLDMYLFAEDVKLDQQNFESSILFLGTKECSDISNRFGLESSKEFAMKSLEAGLVFKGYFGNIPYLLFLGSLAELDRDVKQPLMSLDDLELLRIKNLYPLPGVEYIADKILTPELDHAHRINYQKGCFVGQEVFARLRTYGRTNKVLASICIKNCSESLENLIDQEVSIDGKSKGNVIACIRHQEEIYLTAYVPTALKSLGDDVSVGQFTGVIIA